MAAGFGEYRVKAFYNDAQCDTSCDKAISSGDSIRDAYFDAAATPTVTYTFTPKVGYKITDIAISFYNNVTYEIIGGNKAKVTAASSVVSGNSSGNIEITVTTERNIKYLNDFGLAFFWNRIKAFFVPQTRKVNNKTLSADITLTASDVSAVPLAGGTMTGALNVQTPAADANPATKKYVDDLVGGIAGVLDDINGEVI